MHMNLELLVIINKVIIIEKHVLVTQLTLDNQKIKYVNKPFSIMSCVLHGKEDIYFQAAKFCRGWQPRPIYIYIYIK